MLKLLADENFRGEVVRGLLRALPGIDLLRVQDVGLLGANDPAILEWAADHDRIVLSHDRATLPDFANERVINALPMPGLFVFNNRMSVRQMIEELLVCHASSEHASWAHTVLYFPL
jgi:hypothetical protein